MSFYISLGSQLAETVGSLKAQRVRFSKQTNEYLFSYYSIVEGTTSCGHVVTSSSCSY